MKALKNNEYKQAAIRRANELKQMYIGIGSDTTKQVQRGMPSYITFRKEIESLFGAEELIAGAWFLDRIKSYLPEEVSSFKGIVKFIKEIRHESFDLWIELPNEMGGLKNRLRNLVFAKLCSSRKACGFEVSTFKFWTKEQSSFRKFDNEVERLIKLLKRWAIPINCNIEYDLPIPQGIQKSAETIMNSYGLDKENSFGFVPAAKYAINEWPQENYIELGKLILKQYPQVKVVILGGESDYAKCEHIKEKINNDSVINFCGKLNLLETAFLVKNLGIVISNNTGIMHMASQADTKTIGIFSSAELNGKWFPYGKNARAIMRTYIQCHGCYYKCRNNCLCIKDILPPEILEEINMFKK